LLQPTGRRSGASGPSTGPTEDAFVEHDIDVLVMAEEMAVGKRVQGGSRKCAATRA
jgi:hypothetical protein